MTVVTTCKNEQGGTATGIPYGTIVDEIGTTYRMRFTSLVGLGLGCHVFSFPKK